MSRNSSPYHNAGWLLNEHLQKRRGIKSLAFDGKEKGGAPDKATYATVCKTMQHLSSINEILDANNKRLRNAIGFDSVRNKGLLYVMLYELIFGKYKSIRGGGKIKRMIVKHEEELRREAENYIGVDTSGGNKVTFPRYVRVNTLRTNVSDIVTKLRKDLTKADGDAESETESNTTIYADIHVPDLLVLPPSASSWLHNNYEPVKSGEIILQDKSSCFSALALAHGLGDNAECFDYIDACSAPGNKTSHLAALVHSSLGDVEQPKKKKKVSKSTIYAFERSSSRFSILKERMEQLVPPCNNVEVVPTHADFLQSDPSDQKFANVRGIMLDPSCSGSGIVNSPDRWMEEGGGTKDSQRIQSLSNFQLVALKHAMSFPQVDRIVYSTCSVHEEENEAVVSKALSELGETEDGIEWELMAPVCLDHWPRRGKEGRGVCGLTRSQADCAIRCDGLDGDETNGFFVAFLARKKLVSGSKKVRKVESGSQSILPTYNGQFANIRRKSDDVSAACDSEKKIDSKRSHAQNTKGQKQNSQKPQGKKKDVPPTKATDKSAKKREKKLAWKRKQALQKAERMKKKSILTK